MPTVQAPVQLAVEHLLAAIKQLSPAELREFTQQFAQWQEQDSKRVESEAELLAYIEENSRLPAAAQRRFNRLRRKRQAETLTTSEEAELQGLWQRVEQVSETRLEALTTLAERRGTDVQTLMRELRLPENRDVF